MRCRIDSRCTLNQIIAPMMLVVRKKCVGFISKIDLPYGSLRLPYRWLPETMQVDGVTVV